MSKVKSEFLFHLIKSLTKGEKRQFKIYAGRLNNGTNRMFVQVFDCIERQKNYNENQIRKIKGINPSQIPNLKINLYKQILASLANNFLMTPDNLVARQVEYAKFLYNKCLYNECLHLIEKAKKLAKENFQLIILLELLEIEKSAVLQASDENTNERISKLIDEITLIGAQVQNINRFSNLAVSLTTYYQKLGFIRNSEDLKQVREYYQSNLPSFNLRSLSALESLYLYSTITAFYFFVQDFEHGYKYAKKSSLVFEENPLLKRVKTELYIKTLNSLLVAQNKLHLYTEFKETHHVLVSLKRQKEIKLTENLNLNLFKAIYIHEINRHFMLGEFKSGTRIVNALERELNNFFPKLNKNTVMIFDYKIACLYFGAYQFKSAIKWLNKIINEKASDLREDLQSFSRILRLICYYELGDLEMIQYNIRSTYRFLQKKQNFVGYQKLIMLFLRNIKKTDTPGKTIRQFALLKQQMKKIEKNRFEKRAFIYFDIVSWLESKIEGRTMQEIVQTRAKQLLK